MKFLRDIMVRRSNPDQEENYLDDEFPESEIEESEYTDEQEFEDDNEFVEDFSARLNEIANAEAEEEQEEEEDHSFEEPDEDAILEAEPDDEGEYIEVDEEASAEAQPDQNEQVMAKIWEMFEEDADVPEETEFVEEPESSPQELARQAMDSMVVPPPDSPSDAPPKSTPALVPDVEQTAAPEEPKPVPRAGRAKTRMLGFHNPEPAAPDVFDYSDKKKDPSSDRYPVGWLVIIDGPGRGESFTLHYGVATIGRGADQSIRLDFGDNSISRENHAAIAYDEDLRAFFVGHGGKSNLVRLNGRPVLSTEELSGADLIRIGETTMRFVGFCNPEFDWDLNDDEETMHAAAG